VKCYGFLCQRWGLLEDSAMLELEELDPDELEPLVLPPCVFVFPLGLPLGIVLLPP
jgi:hypothetical protein